MRVFMGGVIVALAAIANLAPAVADEEVNVYSARQEVLILPLLDRFTERTGITVNIVSAKADALLARLQREGINSPADVFLTTDAGRLARAKEAGLLQPAQSVRLEELVPATYRDPEGYWFGISLRARPIIYAKDRVKPSELSTYADLTSQKWAGRICVRSSTSVYNQSMLAAMVVRQGVESAEHWARGLVANFARDPQGGDRDQIRAVAAGECDVALANTYYLAGLAKSKDKADRQAAQKVAIFWPDQDGHGVHVNVSGAGVAKFAPNQGNAVKLLEFLIGEEAQGIYASVVNEYPVVAGAPVADIVASWGTFKADDLNLATLGTYNGAAVRVADRSGWK
jgi:iron(III) transport system substrate-binding protein